MQIKKKKDKQTIESLLKSDVSEMIYFSLTHWDMNPCTKGFSRELSKDIVNYIKERVPYFL